MVLTALLLTRKKRPGTVKLRETIITIQCIKLKVVMLLHHIVMMRRILTKIVRIDLSRIQKRQIGIVRLQEITTTIQYTNLRVVMLQVLNKHTATDVEEDSTHRL